MAKRSACALRSGFAAIVIATTLVQAHGQDVVREPLAEIGGSKTNPELEQHLDRVQSALDDRGVVDPKLADEARNMQWDGSETALVDGDFTDPNDSSSKVGWVAPGKKAVGPKIRKPKLDIEEMTKLRLTEKGNTVLDLQRGQVVYRW